MRKGRRQKKDGACCVARERCGRQRCEVAMLGEDATPTQGKTASRCERIVRARVDGSNVTPTGLGRQVDVEGVKNRGVDCRAPSVG